MNPLHIPEIVSLVGTFFDVWRKPTTSKHDIYLFHPGDLLSCCLVSRMWRAEMLPSLWYIYDGASFTVPSHILKKYAHYIEIMYIREMRFNYMASYDMRNYQTRLYIPSNRNYYNFMLLSQQLRSLDVQPCDDTRYIGTDLTHTIQSLLSLTNLNLRKYILWGSELQTILSNKPVLESLEIISCHIIGPVDMSVLYFAKLKRFRLELSTITHGGLSSLFKTMPFITKFIWITRCDCIYRTESRLTAEALRDFCQHLTSVEFGIRFCKREPVRREHHIKNLIESLNVNVREINLDINSLHPSLSSALCARSGSLTQLTIKCSHRFSEHEGLIRVFQRLTSLQFLSISCNQGKIQRLGVLQKWKNENPSLALTDDWVLDSAFKDGLSIPFFNIWVIVNLRHLNRLLVAVINGVVHRRLISNK